MTPRHPAPSGHLDDESARTSAMSAAGGSTGNPVRACHRWCAAATTIRHGVCVPGGRSGSAEPGVRGGRTTVLVEEIGGPQTPAFGFGMGWSGLHASCKSPERDRARPRAR